MAEIKKFSKHVSKNLIPFFRVMRTTKKNQLDWTWFILPPKPLLFGKIYKGFSKFIKEKNFPLGKVSKKLKYLAHFAKLAVICVTFGRFVRKSPLINFENPLYILPKSGGFV